MASTSLATALFIVAVAAVAPAAIAVTYTVGNEAGWSVLGNDSYYDNWADNKIFYVGDILVFNFITGSHDVAEVNETAYESCNTTSHISLSNSSPVSIPLNTSGEHYYICTFPGHCSGGQKLSIDVIASSTAPPPPTTNTTAPPPPTTNTTAPPPPTTNSASYGGVAALFPMILSAVVVVCMF